MSIKYLTVGTNFDKCQLDYYINCNKRYDKVKIDRVYGSLQTSYINLPSARPNYRLGSADRKEFENYVRTAIDNGIGVDYAANATLTMPIELLFQKKEEIIEHFVYLESVGVDRIIAANPLIMELVTNYTNLSIKCSTILGISRISSIKHYTQYRIDSICPSIYINRNIPLLANMQKECEKYGITLEPLVNEVCIFGDTPCDNVLRTNCYIHSTLGGNPNNRFDSWPFSRCQKAREKYPAFILKTPFILPTYLEFYRKKTGITHFKISGRTNTFEYLKSVVNKYLSETFDEPLGNLFMLPQNTKQMVKKSITVKQLEQLAFFDTILNPEKPCEYQCSKCQYCENIYEKL